MHDNNRVYFASFLAAEKGSTFIFYMFCVLIVQMSKVIKELRASHRLILSGTPIQVNSVTFFMYLTFILIIIMQYMVVTQAHSSYLCIYSLFQFQLNRTIYTIQCTKNIYTIYTYNYTLVTNLQLAGFPQQLVPITAVFKI